MYESGESSMSLPDTYAAGSFNLPLKVAKIARLAEGASTPSERETAIRKLWPLGYFLDRVNILWDTIKVPDYAQDDLYRELKDKERIDAQSN